MIKKILFNKKIYPNFISELNKVDKDKKCLILLSQEDDFCEFVFIINKEIHIFNKKQNQELVIKKLYFSDEINHVYENIQYKELSDIIYKLKINGLIVDSQNIIDFMVTNLNKSIKYYKFSREEISSIFESVLSYRYFFMDNPPATIVESEKNTWID